MIHARHAAPGHAAKLAGRVALGVVGAPVALFAAAGPADAAELVPVPHTADGAVSDAASPVALPDLANLSSALPDLIGFELPSVPGLDALPPSDALPSVDSLPSLPGADSLPGPDALPGTDALPPTDAVTDTVGLITGLI